MASTRFSELILPSGRPATTGQDHSARHRPFVAETFLPGLRSPRHEGISQTTPSKWSLMPRCRVAISGLDAIGSSRSIRLPGAVLAAAVVFPGDLAAAFVVSGRLGLGEREGVARGG